MSPKAVIRYGPVLLALLVAPMLLAADGPPNLGTAAVIGQDGPTRWYLDARFFETNSSQDETDNATYSLGFVAPINNKTDAWLGFSTLDAEGRDPINLAVRSSDRDVLTVAIKRQVDVGSSVKCALTVGADVAVNTATRGVNVGTGNYAKQDTFVPAVKLQLEWGQPGHTQFQLAGQAAWWDDTAPTPFGDAVMNYGTVVAGGGGVTWPISSRLCLVGDAMAILDGDNAITIDNLLDEELVWSAGGTYAFNDRFNTTLSVYATNSLSPTLAGSTIAASDDGAALGLALRRDL